MIKCDVNIQSFRTLSAHSSGFTGCIFTTLPHSRLLFSINQLTNEDYAKSDTSLQLVYCEINE